MADPNPYIPPQTESKPRSGKYQLSDFGDSPRQQLATLLGKLVAREISISDLGFTADELLTTFDPVIQYVELMIEDYFDDDLCAMPDEIAKSEWDFVQRLRLLLTADCRIVETRYRRWSWRQLAAAVSLCVCCAAGVSLGASQWLSALSVIVGLVAWSLCSLREKELERLVKLPPLWILIAPFQSLGDLKRAVDTTGFRKQRYARPRADRNNPVVLMQLWRIPAVVGWCCFSPFILLFLCFPIRHTQKEAVCNA